MRPLKIAHQTLLISLGPALLITLVLISFFTYERLKDLAAERDAIGQIIADQLAPAAAYGLFSGNQVDLEHLLQMALRTPNLQHVEIWDSQGQVIAHAQETPNHSARLYHFHASVLHQPVVLQNDFLSTRYAASADTPITLGQVRVGMSSEAFSQRQQLLLIKAAMLTLFTLLLTYWLAKRLALQLSAPISAMAQAVRAIKNGRYHIALPHSAQTEMGQLTGHINELADALDHTSREQRLSIEALTHAREEAEHANSAKSDFLAMMSHELRTPMNGVLGMLQLLGTTRLTHEQAEYLTLANESTSHLLAVINDILDFSATERGALKLEHIPFNLEQLIESTVETFRPDATIRKLSFNLHIATELKNYQALGDPTRLRQILVNLIGNAIKFTERGGVRVVINPSTDNRGAPWLHCTVYDTGVGIAPEHLPKIFDAFAQADSSISRRYGGTGLGLAIARALAEQMGGSLSAESTLGAGSIFYLQIPLASAERLALETRLVPAEHLVKGATVLLAEDNPINQVVIEAMLRSLGHEVIIAEDGAKALSTIQTHALDIVLMDCLLPVMDGYQATRRIRQLPLFDQLPIIALTANAMPGDREACLSAGMSDYLAKPFKRADLQQILNTWLAQSADPASHDRQSASSSMPLPTLKLAE